MVGQLLLLKQIWPRGLIWLVRCSSGNNKLSLWLAQIIITVAQVLVSSDYGSSGYGKFMLLLAQILVCSDNGSSGYGKFILLLAQVMVGSTYGTLMLLAQVMGSSDNAW